VAKARDRLSRGSSGGDMNPGQTNLLWESLPLEGKDDHMKRHRHTPEQAVRRLHEGERMLNEGSDLTDVLKQLEIAESTWNRYGGMKADGAKKLKELEIENVRLKKLLAEAELDKAMLKELAEGKW
jgi:putative transposase